MTYWNTLLLEKAESVLTIRNIHDAEITFQKQKKIKEKIKNIDLLFYEEIENKPNFSFSFGDKYFYKINESLYVCIPSIADINYIHKYILDKQIANHIKKDFLLFFKQARFEGYFDIN